MSSESRAAPNLVLNEAQGDRLLGKRGTFLIRTFVIQFDPTHRRRAELKARRLSKTQRLNALGLTYPDRPRRFD
jgi:hypothetical protein